MSANTGSVRQDFYEDKLTGKKFFALFDGIVKTGGSLIKADDRFSLELVLSDKALAFYLIERLSDVIKGEVKLDRESTEGISQGRYVLSIFEPDCFALLKECNVVDMDGDDVVDFDDDSSAKWSDKLFPYFLRGVFWTKGNLFTPEDDGDGVGNKGACRTEMSGLDPVTASLIKERLAAGVIGEDGIPVEINLNITEKGEKATLYSASMETICNLLAFVGATKTVLEFNELIMVRQLRNSTNRQANCDFGNAVRTSEAGARQTEAIKKIRTSPVWDTLDEKLTAVALLRLEDPEATVRELAEKTGLSRSGVYHRLEKLEELANMPE